MALATFKTMKTAGTRIYSHFTALIYVPRDSSITHLLGVECKLFSTSIRPHVEGILRIQKNVQKNFSWFILRLKSKIWTLKTAFIS